MGGGGGDQGWLMGCCHEVVMASDVKCLGIHKLAGANELFGQMPKIHKRPVIHPVLKC